jgi:hypothetical protein
MHMLSKTTCVENELKISNSRHGCNFSFYTSNVMFYLCIEFNTPGATASLVIVTKPTAN